MIIKNIITVAIRNKFSCKEPEPAAKHVVVFWQAADSLGYVLGSPMLTQSSPDLGVVLGRPST